jgi:hypothetical protein
MARTIRQEVANELIAESQRLRDELLRAAARLDGFAAELASEVADMRDTEEEMPDGG